MNALNLNYSTSSSPSRPVGKGKDTLAIAALRIKSVWDRAVNTYLRFTGLTLAQAQNPALLPATCVNWKGQVQNEGYGTIRIGLNSEEMDALGLPVEYKEVRRKHKTYMQRKQKCVSITAHRMAIYIACSEPIAGGSTSHICEAGHRGCVNAAHISLGTQRDNIKDGVQSGRHNRSGFMMDTKKDDAVLAEAIYNVMMGKLSARKAADKYSISKGYVSLLLNRKAKPYIVETILCTYPALKQKYMAEQYKSQAA